MANDRTHPILRDLKGGLVGIGIEIAVILTILAVAGIVTLVATLVF